MGRLADGQAPLAGGPRELFDHEKHNNDAFKV